MVNTQKTEKELHRLTIQQLYEPDREGNYYQLVTQRFVDGKLLPHIRVVSKSPQLSALMEVGFQLGVKNWVKQQDICDRFISNPVLLVV